MPHKTKEQAKLHNRNYYLKHKAKRRAYNELYEYKVRDFILFYKLDNPCKCGEWHPACLQFHHRDPNEKESEIANAIRLGWSIRHVKAEIAKCDVMCANCHMIHHFETRHWRSGNVSHFQ